MFGKIDKCLNFSFNLISFTLRNSCTVFFTGFKLGVDCINYNDFTLVCFGAVWAAEISLYHYLIFWRSITPIEDEDLTCFPILGKDYWDLLWNLFCSMKRLNLLIYLNSDLNIFTNLSIFKLHFLIFKFYTLIILKNWIWIINAHNSVILNEPSEKLGDSVSILSIIFGMLTTGW